MAFLYMVECVDGSYYTGIAADIVRRMAEHSQKGAKCARYTRAHPVKRIAALWETDSLAHAAKGEYAVKKLTRRNKEKLVAAPEKLDYFCPALALFSFEPRPEITLADCLKKVEKAQNRP